MKRVTMQDIADRLGVTKVTVSKAINNQPGVSSALRESILRAAREMSYAKSAPAETRYRLAFVCPKRFFLEDDTFYTTIYYYINKRCSERGHSLSCFVINSADEISLRLPEPMCTSYFDGLLIAGEFRRDYLELLRALPGTQVAVDFYLPELPIDCVVTDNFFLGQLVTEYLVRHGHRQIGFVGDIMATSSIGDRYFGYVKVLTQNGLPVREQWRIVNNDALTGQYTQSCRLPEALPTAFVCHCDKAAFTLARQLETMGVSVPGEVSIISFDNTNLCELMRPHLTSVHFDRREIAKRSIQALFTRIESPDAPVGIQYLQGTLIERDSVAIFSS